MFERTKAVSGLVLCGGQSRRMGRPKELLPFGPTTMLGRVLETVARAMSTVDVVAGPQTLLPELPPNVGVIRDPVEGLGPLQGLAAGLSSLEGRFDAAFVASCDAPLLHPDVVDLIIRNLGDAPAAVVRWEDGWHPLLGAYRTDLAGEAQARVTAGRLRMIDFVEEIGARPVDADLFTEVDPELASLQNVNTPEAYESALKAAGMLEG